RDGPGGRGCVLIVGERRRKSCHVVVLPFAGEAHTRLSRGRSPRARVSFYQDVVTSAAASARAGVRARRRRFFLCSTTAAPPAPAETRDIRYGARTICCRA